MSCECSKQAITRQVCYSKCKCKQQQDTYSYITSMFGVYESSYKKTFAMSATDIINIIFSSRYCIMYNGLPGNGIDGIGATNQIIPPIGYSDRCTPFTITAIQILRDSLIHGTSFPALKKSDNIQ